ncbi:hypothetical protein E2C01_073768 [Portunus trituberculatus]|uniref:Uncharacterized protein n=1 Tax=Portunus trituberculatus TaxID=210409 RepID=A0A5B7I682_PORTR|nr:hypothetical protein [Portunus trituberculatus]
MKIRMCAVSGTKQLGVFMRVTETLAEGRPHSPHLSTDVKGVATLSTQHHCHILTQYHWCAGNRHILTQYHWCAGTRHILHSITGVRGAATFSHSITGVRKAVTLPTLNYLTLLFKDMKKANMHLSRNNSKPFLAFFIRKR